MPNGLDRNFVRFLKCIGGFKAKYNHWPTKVRIDPSDILEFKSVMRHDDLKTMLKNIILISDESNPWDGLYVAEDEEGNSYDLMVEHGYDTNPENVIKWLGINWPDYGPE